MLTAIYAKELAQSAKEAKRLEEMAIAEKIVIEHKLDQTIKLAAEIGKTHAYLYPPMGQDIDCVMAYLTHKGYKVQRLSDCLQVSWEDA